MITPTALQRAVNVMNNRVNQLGVSQPQITTDGKNLIDVQLPNVPERRPGGERTSARPRSCSSTTGRPTSSTPPQSACGRRDPDRRRDRGRAQPGEWLDASDPGRQRGGGRAGFYEAVKLASKQPLDPEQDATARASATSTSCSARPGARPVPPSPRRRTQAPEGRALPDRADCRRPVHHRARGRRRAAEVGPDTCRDGRDPGARWSSRAPRCCRPRRPTSPSGPSSARPTPATT